MRTTPDIQLPTTLRDALARGHPWVYRNHVPSGRFLPSGTWVRLRCGGWSGYALWDAEGAIAARVFSVHQVPDANWVRARVADAWQLRAPLRAAGHTAYRWLYGEGDGVPGLTVDRYGPYAVLLTYLPGARTLINWLVDALFAVDPALRGVVVRGGGDEEDGAAEQGGREAGGQAGDDGRWTIDDGSTSIRRGAVAAPAVAAPAVAAPPAPGAHGEAAVRGPSSVVPHSTGNQKYTVIGEEPPSELIVTEHGLRFLADVRGGQKSGLFLDHRENRRYVEGLSAGRSVLNCFAYTGGFSLYALRGGARYVISCDIGKGLAASADANIELNRYLDRARHEFVTEDCFTLLERYVEQGETFDLVVLDPPSFARRKESRHAAVRAYTRANALALRCVAPGGLLATASCTSQVGPEAFRDMLGAAAQSAHRRVRIIHEAGQPRDHPVPAGFPEGRYLKFLVAGVGEIA